LTFNEEEENLNKTRLKVDTNNHIGTGDAYPFDNKEINATVKRMEGYWKKGGLTMTGAARRGVLFILRLVPVQVSSCDRTELFSEGRKGVHEQCE